MIAHANLAPERLSTMPESELTPLNVPVLPRRYARVSSSVIRRESVPSTPAVESAERNSGARLKELLAEVIT